MVQKKNLATFERKKSPKSIRLHPPNLVDMHNYVIIRANFIIYPMDYCPALLNYEYP